VVNQQINKNKFVYIKNLSIFAFEILKHNNMKVSKKVIERAKHYLSYDSDTELAKAIEMIAKHENGSDLVSDVDDIVVWSPLVDELRVETFLDNIGYGEKDKEMRVCVINYLTDEMAEDIDDVAELTDDKFMFAAEEIGRVYTLEGFQIAFNKSEVDTDEDIIRFIEVEI
jgi:hypothetical protein